MARAIAVVEDDESIREMLRYYFQSVGYAVRAYESGEALFAGEEGQSLPAQRPGLAGHPRQQRVKVIHQDASNPGSP